MDSGKIKGPVCGVENCRSRVYEEGEDGYLYCQNGHRKGELVVGQDDDDFTSAARARTRRQKADDDGERVYKYFKSKQAFDLYLKSLQLIIRHQVWFLVHDKGLPAELEAVVLDLWGLRMLQLEHKISDEGHSYDSQSQGFDTSESESDFEKEVVRSLPREKKLKCTPGLIDSLALCYLGIITLRLPVTPGDIHKWVTDGKMAYHRAIKHVPSAIRDRLPASYHAVLDPNAILKFERLYSAIIDLQVSFEKEHGIIWPGLNYPLILFRYLKELALPLELYDATTRLAGLLEYEFALHTTGKRKLGIRHLPEAQLVSCLLVCVKLMFPFDGERRDPRTTSEPAATAIDWDEWYKDISSSKPKIRDGVSRYTTEELMNLKEKDVFSMAGNQFDQYLDWYHETFIDEARIEENKDGDFRRALYDMFPIEASPVTNSSIELSESLVNKEKLEVIKAVHSKLKPRRMVGREEETVRPGQGYKFYKKEKDLPKPARQFYEEAARITGFSLEMLVLAVFSTEKKIETWKAKQRQKAK